VTTDIDLVPHVARKRKIDVVLSNSFGFAEQRVAGVSPGRLALSVRTESFER